MNITNSVGSIIIHLHSISNILGIYNLYISGLEYKMPKNIYKECVLKCPPNVIDWFLDNINKISKNVKLDDLLCEAIMAENENLIENISKRINVVQYGILEFCVQHDNVELLDTIFKNNRKKDFEHINIQILFNLSIRNGNIKISTVLAENAMRLDRKLSFRKAVKIATANNTYFVLKWLFDNNDKYTNNKFSKSFYKKLFKYYNQIDNVVLKLIAENFSK